MKKIIIGTILILCIFGCAGCKKEKGKEEKEHVITSEDYVWGNTNDKQETPLLKSDKGHYYYSELYGGWRYYDLETGQDMFLCNKPECKHDGNVFCVATNAKYRYERFTMYNDMIYATAVEETETQYLYKLVAIALDGSELTEIATYLSVERTGQAPDFNDIKKELCIHRNKALIPMTALGEAGLYDTRVYGTALLDLDTKKVEYLDETPLSKDNLVVSNITGYGDYIYYCRREGKKNVLHRRSVKDNSDESYKLLIGFNKQYVVLSDDKIVYLKSRDSAMMLCVHNHATGENVEMKPYYWTQYIPFPNGEIYEQQIPHKISVITTDGTYLYLVHGSIGSGTSFAIGAETGVRWHVGLRILDYDLKELTYVNIADCEFPEDIPQMALSGGRFELEESLHFFGEDIFLPMFEWDPRSELDGHFHGLLEEAGIYTFKFKRSDLLQGKVKAEYVYKREVQE